MTTKNEQQGTNETPRTECFAESEQERSRTNEENDRSWFEFQVPLHGVILALMILVVGWGLYKLHTPDITHHGIIKVDSPEVYSRERLVNDRFTQRFWLDEELEKTRNSAIPNQASMSSDRGSDIVAKAGVHNVPTEHNDNAPSTTGPQPGKNTDSTTGKPTGLDRFRDILAFREEIRGEIMETLLDDRHDLKGNTLYRLKFDTTLLPMRNNFDWALVDVSFRRGEYNSVEAGKLFEEWLARLNKELAETFFNQRRAFLARSMDEKEFSLFESFLKRSARPPAHNHVPVWVQFCSDSDKKLYNEYDWTYETGWIQTNDPETIDYLMLPESNTCRWILPVVARPNVLLNEDQAIDLGDSIILSDTTEKKT